jgi:hypothetical protein
MRELGLSGAIEVPPIIPAANGELTVRHACGGAGTTTGVDPRLALR